MKAAKLAIAGSPRGLPCNRMGAAGGLIADDVQEKQKSEPSREQRWTNCGDLGLPQKSFTVAGEGTWRRRFRAAPGLRLLLPASVRPTQKARG